MTKSVVFTSMVGDLFHFGHLELLRRCKNFGDVLIVGVIKDEEVLRYKKRSPVISFEQRIEIIKHINFVNQVMPQDTRDGTGNLKRLQRVDFLIRGDDAVLKTEVETIKLLGGKFVQLQRTPNISTSEIIEKIKKQ